MDKIRVLIVDDSVVIRRLLTDILNADPGIEVVGTAPNGRIALAKLPQLNPDLVTLDIEMPEMDGLATLPELRKVYPKLPVIMFSTLTERGALATFDALTLGASDYVAKPANVGSVSAGIQSVQEQLIPKIKALAVKQQARPAEAKPKLVARPAALQAAAANRPPQRFDALIIGCSTGGPQALATLLRGLPADFPLGIAVVQHMPPVFTRHLAARLDQESALQVKEASSGDVVTPGTVLIAPGDFHLALRRQGPAVKCIIQQEPPQNSCRPAVDVLFHSAADVFGAGCLGVILTGMGQDGLRGSQQIVERGGAIVAQDQPSCVVWGMPRAVVEAGLARHIVPLTSMSQELVRLAGMGRRAVAAV
ncbi:MAG TPA: chemotaxis response regulator protein-glutamate methylesterase [Lacipirellula sp.]